MIMVGIFRDINIKMFLKYSFLSVLTQRKCCFSSRYVALHSVPGLSSVQSVGCVTERSVGLCHA